MKSQNLLRPSEFHFNKLGFSDIEKQFFHEVWEYDGRNQLVKHYVFNEPWRFVLRIRPNMIDKVKRIDALIESREQEIENYLRGNHYRGRLNKVVHGSNYRRWKSPAKPHLNEIKNKSLPQLLDALRNNEP